MRSADLREDEGDRQQNESDEPDLVPASLIGDG